MARIRLTAGKVEMTATLNAGQTAKALLGALPLSGRANRWGDEVYFDVPLQLPPENPQATVPSGTIAYWPDGPALCIFFGQTPYSPVNVLGTLDGDPKEWAKVQSGQTVIVQAAG